MLPISRKIFVAALLLQSASLFAQEKNFLLLDPITEPNNWLAYLRASVNPEFVRTQKIREVHLVNVMKDGSLNNDSTVMHFRADGNIDSLWWYGKLTTVYEYNGDQLARYIRIENGKHSDTCTYTFSGRHCTEMKYCWSGFERSCQSTKYYWLDDRPKNKYVGDKLSLSWTCDSLGRITLETDNSRGYAQTKDFFYDSKGRWSGGSDYTIAYDDQGRFTNYEYSKNNLFDRIRISYDDKGLPVLMEEAERVRTSDFADPDRSKKVIIRCVK